MNGYAREASPPVPLSLTGEGGRLRRGYAEKGDLLLARLVVESPPSPVRERGTGGEASKGTSLRITRPTEPRLTMEHAQSRSTTTDTFMPTRRGRRGSGGSVKTILTGTRCTTFVKLPVALSGGSRENLAPVAAASDSMRPRKAAPG